MNPYLVSALMAFSAISLVSAPRKAKPTAPVVQKRLDKKLSDFGLTPRSLATWKASAGQPSITFYEVSFKKFEPPVSGSRESSIKPAAFLANGLLLNGFQIEGSDYLANSKEYRTLALLRLNKDAPQASKDSGQTWIDGEKVGESWLFAFANETLSLQNADEVFTPIEFKAWGVERETLAKTEKASTSTLVPYFHSAVLACAFGRNELQGLMKFPGAAFVIPMRGLRVKDRWLIRSTEASPFASYLWDHPGPTWWARGIRELGNERQVLQMELSDGQWVIGNGPFINYGIEGDSTDQLKTALVFDLAKGKPLPDLAERFKVNRTRNLWTKSDEEGSYSREADAAFIAAGLKVWFYPSYQTDNSGFLMSGYPKKAEDCQKPMVDRILRLGGKVGFIGQ